MKKNIYLLVILMSTAHFGNAQGNIYLTLDFGSAFPFASHHIASAVKANGFGDNYSQRNFWGEDVNTSNPEETNQTFNYRIRAGYTLNDNAAIEAGFGITSNTTTKGADAKPGVTHIDFLEMDKTNSYIITAHISTLSIVYLWNDNRERFTAGIGPAASFCNIKQGTSQSSFISDKHYVLPGVCITGGWHFVNKERWFLGMRTDLIISSPAKTEEVKIVNAWDNNFTSVSKSFSVGGFTGSLLLSAVIKF